MSGFVQRIRKRKRRNDTMIHLEVKSDGLIYVIKDCPEEPKYTDFVQHTKYYWQVNKFERAKRDYLKALASCERILCADQEQAKEIIFYELYGGPQVDIPWSVVARNYSDKIFDIPNVEFTINAECPTWCSDCKYFDWSTCRDKYIAILKESPKEEESQEELTALDLKMFIEHELGGYKTVHMGRSHHVINRQFVYESDIMSLAEDLLRNFTITRKK